jgi:peptide/nickel transport system substrate-binding protein
MVISSFVGCITNIQSDEDNIRYKDLIVGICADCQGFHPWIESFDVDTMSINHNIFDSLVKFDLDFKIIPCLAVSWNNPDNLTWRFKIRQGVTFHNGYTLTAEDVKYSINLILDDEKNVLRNLITSVSEVYVVDDFTVDIKTKKPNPILINRLTDIFIVSKRYQEGEHAKTPIGTGPYELVEREDNNHIIMQRYEEYWDQLPEVEKVVFRIIEDDEKRKDAILSGEIDIGYIQSSFQKEFINISGIDLKYLDYPSVTYIGFDFRYNNSPSFLDEKNPFSDVTIRKAVYHAINVSIIIKKHLNDLAIPASQYITSNVFGFDPSIKRLPYDLEKAKNFMTDAGYSGGFSVELNCGNNDFSLNISREIASQLSEIGINVIVEGEPIDDFFGRLGERNTSFYLSGWLASTADGGEIFDLLLRSVDIDANTGYYNTGYYSNPEIDIIGEQISSIMNPTERLKLMQDGFQIAMDDVACIPLFSSQLIFASRDFIDWTPRGDLGFIVKDVCFR